MSFFKALHKAVTCLEQIVLCTSSSAAVQSVSSLDIFSDALVSTTVYQYNGIASYRIAYKGYIVQTWYTAQALA